MTGAAILRSTPSAPTSSVVVEFAWGALPYGNTSRWTWTDVTTDVLLDKQISMTVGRADEGSTPSPAQCSFVLKNTSGNYSQGGQSANYPNVKRGVPVRVRVIVSSVSHTRFQGYAASFTPGWDITGKWATVAVVAAGTKRRLQRQTSPVVSPMTFSLPQQSPAPVAYWPLEDGKNALYGTSAVANGSPMSEVDYSLGGGSIEWAADTGFPGTLASPVLKAGESLVGAVTGTTTAWSVLWGQNIDGATGAECFFYFGSAVIEVLTYTDGSMDVIYTAAGSFSGTTVISIGVTSPPSVWTWMAISLIQSGSNIAVTLGANGGAAFATISSTTLRGLDTVTLNSPTGTTGPTAFSQCVVYPTGWNSLSTAITGSGVAVAAFKGYAGETAQARMVRLSSQQGEVFTTANPTGIQLMGVQPVGSYLTLMEACAAVDQGVLCDGFAQGLTYISQDEIAGVSASLALDASLGQLAGDVSPVDDDQLTINTYTATRAGGATVTVADTTSPQGALAIGTYDGSATVDCASDGQQLTDIAGWKVNLGTFAGYRFPTAEVWLHQVPGAISSWLLVTLMSRLDITKLSSVAAQLVNATVSLLIEGWTEVIDQYVWTVKMNCTNYDPWRVGEIATATSDTNEFLWRPDTIGSTVASGCAVGGTSITVNSTDLYHWTTTADDCPIALNIAGNKVTATAISGTSSPQTFTLTGSTVTHAISSGGSVSLWQPTVLDVTI